MPSPQELADLTTLQERLREIERACVSYLGTVDSATPETLKHMGYQGKTNAEAMQLAPHHDARAISGMEQLRREQEQANPTCGQCGRQTLSSGFVKVRVHDPGFDPTDPATLPDMDIHRTCVWPWLSSHPECAVSMAPDSVP